MKLKSLFLALMLINIVALVMVVFSIDAYQQKMGKLEQAYVTKNRSFLLADELRQSSDDLTRLARTYVITGNIRFKEQFFDVLDIRNGIQPRPQHYNRIYWDFMAIDGSKPRLDGRAIPLRELMKQAGFTQEELALLTESQNQSDALVSLERQAMNAVEGIFLDAQSSYMKKGTPDFKLAREIMHSEEYHRIKVEIMKPLNRFFQLFEARTDSMVTEAKREVKKIENILSLAIILLMLLLLTSIGNILSRIIYPIEALNRSMLRLARNDMEAVIPECSHHDEVGEMIGAVRIFKENAEKLILSERGNKLLLDSAGEGIFGLDEQGTLTFLNPTACEILGFDATELISRPWYEVIGHTKELNLTERLLLDPKAGKHSGERAWKRRDGSVFPVAFVSTPVEGARGWVEGSVIVFSDITERKKSEEALKSAKEEAEAANRSKTLFLANMSHELRTPLNAILGFAKLLLKNNRLNTQEKENLETIHKSGTYLLTIINEILEVAKLQAGKMQIENATFDLHSFIQSIDAMFRMRVESKGLRFDIYGLESLPKYITADEQRLQQVLINLIGNAIKFTDQGNISLHASHDSQHLRIEVSDSGCGIAPQELPLIFKPFEQAKSAKASQQGTGLGLAIVREIIHLMGGEIEVKSEVGEGSRFWFVIDSLPVSYCPLSTSQHVSGLWIPTQEVGSYTVLIVDDIAENRQLLVQVIRSYGFAVLEATDGPNAVELVRTERPDLMFLDIQMPEMDGYEVIRLIRSQIDLPQLPIVAVSANVFDEDQKRALDSGADRFIKKPVEESELIEVLSDLLGVVFSHDATTLTESNQNIAFSKLPQETVQQILHAAKRLDSNTLEKLFEQHHKLDPKILNKLHDWSKNYHYAEIITYCEKWLKKDIGAKQH